MANYVYIENKEIKEYYDFLPQCWKNISGFNLLINDENYLKNLGWYKVVKKEINYNSNNQTIVGYDYSFENDNVYETPIIKDYTPIQEVIEVPSQISATQLRLWLIRHNVSLSSVEEAINSLEDEMIKQELKVRWEYAPYFDRNNIFINQIGSILGLDSQQIDQAFIEAYNYN